MKKEPVSVYIKFKESIFQDMNMKSHIFPYDKYDVVKTAEGMYLISKDNEEEILIPWHNIVVVRLKTKPSL